MEFISTPTNLTEAGYISGDLLKANSYFLFFSVLTRSLFERNHELLCSDNSIVALDKPSKSSDDVPTVVSSANKTDFTGLVGPSNKGIFFFCVTFRTLCFFPVSYSHSQDSFQQLGVFPVNLNKCPPIRFLVHRQDFRH